MEEKIVIVSDVDNLITFDVVKTDTINREEVAEAQAEIERLIDERTEIDEKIVALREKLAYAQNIIDLANAQSRIDETIEHDAEEKTEEQEG